MVKAVSYSCQKSAVIVRYRGMKVSNMKQIDAYCEVRYGTQVFRTPCVRGSGNPAWNWQFEVKLEARQGGHAPGGEGECKSVQCRSTQTLPDTSFDCLCSSHAVFWLTVMLCTSSQKSLLLVQGSWPRIMAERNCK